MCRRCRPPASSESLASRPHHAPAMLNPQPPPSPKDASPASRASTWCVCPAPACMSPSPAAAHALKQVMQSQMIDMQSSLDRILSAVQSQSQAFVQAGSPIGNGAGPGAPQGYPPPGNSSRDSPVIGGPLPPGRNGAEMYGPPGGGAQGDGPPRARAFPPLPGFAPPVRVLASSVLGTLLANCGYLFAAAQVCDVWDRAEHGAVIGRRVGGYSPSLDAERAH